jgi:hypothetical protein
MPRRTIGERAPARLLAKDRGSHSLSKEDTMLAGATASVTIKCLPASTQVRQMPSHVWALSRGRWARLWAALTRQSTRLLSLAEVKASCAVVSRRSGGTRTVPLRQVRGTEGRCDGFDCHFHPLQANTADRWTSIARARQQGTPLPPVDLVQVGDLYFVIDGHHRISVARALGQRYIEANLTVWEVAGPLPWDANARRASGG